MKIKFSAILTIEAALAAVENDGYVLKYVPNELRTEAVALKAVENDGYALQYVLDIELFRLIAAKLNIDIEF